jgi:hypothetical protein
MLFLTVVGSCTVLVIREVGEGPAGVADRHRYVVLNVPLLGVVVVQRLHPNHVVAQRVVGVVGVGYEPLLVQVRHHLWVVIIDLLLNIRVG